MLTLAVGLLALAGCGSSSKSTSTNTPASAPATTPATSSSAAGGQTLSVAANPEGQLKFTTSTLTAKAGNVTINFANSSSVEHNLTIESGGKVAGATPTFQGGSKPLSVTLKPGSYKFYCSVPGHRMAGMEGTLTVQ
jgi:plastocyanin